MNQHLHCPIYRLDCQSINNIVCLISNPRLTDVEVTVEEVKVKTEAIEDRIIDVKVEPADDTEVNDSAEVNDSIEHGCIGRFQLRNYNG